MTPLNLCLSSRTPRPGRRDKRESRAIPAAKFRQQEGSLASEALRAVVELRPREVHNPPRTKANRCEAFTELKLDPSYIREQKENNGGPGREAAGYGPALL